MTTLTMPQSGRFGRGLRRVLTVLGATVAIALPEIRKHVRPAAQHIQEHAYGIAGLGLIDAAAFVHSTFTGLLVTGVSFLVFEWKVSE